MAAEGGRIDFMFLGPPPLLPGRWIRYCNLNKKKKELGDLEYLLVCYNYNSNKQKQPIINIE